MRISTAGPWLAAALVACTATTAPAQTCRQPADVVPEGGDGQVTIADVMTLMRYVVGNDVPDEEEARAADVAPTSERGAPFCDPCPLEAWGDGVVGLADVQVALRVVVGLDPLAWPMQRAGSAYQNAPPHVAVRWTVPLWPEDCDELLQVSHAPDAVRFHEEPCADVGLQELGLNTVVTCWLAEPDAGRGMAELWWRTPHPAGPLPIYDLRVLTTGNAWVRVGP